MNSEKNIIPVLSVIIAILVVIIGVLMSNRNVELPVDTTPTVTQTLPTKETEGIEGTEATEPTETEASDETTEATESSATETPAATNPPDSGDSDMLDGELGVEDSDF